MTHICAECGKLINNGDRVTVPVTSTYHVIKSVNSFCLDKYDLESDSSKMVHEQCTDGYVHEGD